MGGWQGVRMFWMGGVFEGWGCGVRHLKIWGLGVRVIGRVGCLEGVRGVLGGGVFG